MNEVNDKNISKVIAYYDNCLSEHGATPQGVDYGQSERQDTCFTQLAKIIPQNTEPFTLLDYGCGYGALLTWLQDQKYQCSYTGFDITESMIKKARSLFKQTPEYEFTSKPQDLKISDYLLASGIFNIRLKNSDDVWLQHITSTLDHMWTLTRKGMAFNILTSYSDSEKMQERLYYADPCQIFDYCKRKYSRNVALLHDYDVYEFTILVRR